MASTAFHVLFHAFTAFVHQEGGFFILTTAAAEPLRCRATCSDQRMKVRVPLHPLRRFSIYEPVLFRDSSGIHGAIIALELLYLTSSCPWVHLKFIKELCQFGNGQRRFFVEFLQVFLCVFGENDGVHINSH